MSAMAGMMILTMVVSVCSYAAMSSGTPVTTSKVGGSKSYKNVFSKNVEITNKRKRKTKKKT
jgi:hypothetical protein